MIVLALTLASLARPHGGGGAAQVTLTALGAVVKPSTARLGHNI